ncbi:MAG: NADH-quinone oxidoreductase subunit L, partial [Armatimonadetes bacterium]|nr:NADH-quinone oxidoreductase subunit L [Armatimonadota bacterium]
FALFQATGTLTFNNAEGTGVLDQAGLVRTTVLFGWPAVEVVCLLLMVGCTGKSAQLPLYLWLPDAMEGPTPVSALIHAATMVTAGVYLVARSAPLFALAEFAGAVVAWVGIATALWAALLAVRQYDIKRVLAYSTVSQLGYMFVGVGVGAYGAGISHLVTHAFFKALMFLGAGAVMHALDGQLDLRKMGNLKAHLRVTYGTFLVGWLAISGVPPLSGFFSKDAILEGAFAHGYPVIGAVGLVVAALTAFYMSRMFFAVFWGAERIELGDDGHGSAAPHTTPTSHGRPQGREHGARGHGGDHHHHRPHVHPEMAVMNAPLVVLALLSAVGGFLVKPMNGFLAPVTTEMAAKARAGSVRRPVEAGHGAAAAAAAAEQGHAEGQTGSHAGAEGHGPVPEPVLWALSVAAAALGIGLAFVNQAKLAAGWSPRAEKAIGIHADLYEGGLHTIFVRWGTGFSQALYDLVDRLLIDNLVNGTGKFVEFLAESLRTLQSGYVRNYALVILIGGVFVLDCFFVILQIENQAQLLMVIGGIMAGVVLLSAILSGVGALLARRQSSR